jgi:hypothetical protein
VKTARRNHGIAGQKRAIPNPEILNQDQAANHCGVSTSTIRRLVAAELLPKHQIVPYAPWEIRRSDLDSEPIRDIVHHLITTGKLALEPGLLTDQRTLL